MNKRCMICGEEFDARRHDAKVCGDTCRTIKKKQDRKKHHESPIGREKYRLMLERRRVLPRSVRCVICGKSFLANHAMVKCCSDSCRSEKDKRYYHSDERKAWRKQYLQRHDVRLMNNERRRKRRHIPEVRERELEYKRQRRSDPKLAQLDRERTAELARNRKASAQFFRAQAMVGAVTEATKEPTPC